MLTGLPVGPRSADRVVDGQGRAAPGRGLRSAPGGCASAAGLAALGCQVPRAHLHVVRRDNPNGALAKSRRQRVVPLDFLVVQAFDDYEFERGGVPGAGRADFVMVNLFREPIGAPMPPDAVGVLVAAAARAGRARAVGSARISCDMPLPATLLTRAATLDEVAELLGHASMSSSQVYLHPDPARLRDADRSGDRPAGIGRGRRDDAGRGNRDAAGGTGSATDGDAPVRRGAGSTGGRGDRRR